MSLKKQIRSLTVGKKVPLQTRVVKFLEGTDDEYEVGFRQPTRKDKKLIMSKCVDKESGLIDNIDLQTWAVIALTVDPENGEPLFTEGDFEHLSDLPSDTWFDEYAEIALSMVAGFNGEPSDPKELPKG